MNFRGVIIEESLADASVLKEVKILKTVIEQVTADFATPWLKQWTQHNVEIAEAKIDEVAAKVSRALDPEHGGSWYADFGNNAFHYIVFRNKIFRVDRNKKTSYEEAVNYGLALGIPAHQLDFSANVNEW